MKKYEVFFVYPNHHREKPNFKKYEVRLPFKDLVLTAMAYSPAERFGKRLLKSALEYTLLDINRPA